MTGSTRASEFVTDTMGLILRIEGRKLGARARAVFEDVEDGKVRLYVPSLVFAEILYLSEKQRIQASLSDVSQYFQRHPECQEYPLSLAVVQAATQIADIPELHDRLIATTAFLLQTELITNDPVIAASSLVRTIW